MLAKIFEACIFRHAAPHWTRPEQVRERRPLYTISAGTPGADVTAAAAAALAAVAVAFQGDSVYASRVKTHAEQPYQ